MNRRELAKNGVFGLFGFLVAKVMPEKKKPLTDEQPNFTVSTGARPVSRHIMTFCLWSK